MIHNQAAFGGDCSPLSVRIIKSVDDCLREFKKAIVSGNYVTREISKSHQIKQFTKTAETDLLTVRTGLLLLNTLSKSSISFPTLDWCFYLKLNSNQNQYKSQKFPLFLNCLVTHSNNKDVTPALTLNETNKLDFNNTMEFDTNEKRTLANLM